MNDLHYVIKDTTLAAYADDTQIFFAGDDVAQVDSINRDLGRTDKWYVTNGMKRNHKKYKAMEMGKSEANVTFMCEGTVIPIEREVELLGVVVDSKLKFKGQISKICRKVSQQVAVLNKMKKMLPLEIRKQPY